MAKYGSDRGYEKLPSFKCADIHEWELWNSSDLTILYALLNTCSWTSFRASIEVDQFCNEISLKAYVASSFIVRHFSTVILLPEWSKGIMRSFGIHLTFCRHTCCVIRFCCRISFIVLKRRTLVLFTEGQCRILLLLLLSKITKRENLEIAHELSSIFYISLAPDLSTQLYSLLSKTMHLFPFKICIFLPLLSSWHITSIISATSRTWILEYPFTDC